MKGQKERMCLKQACAEWIEELMDKENIKPSRLADLMGCSLSAISKMQNRKETRIPTILELFRLSKALGISLDDIAYGILRHMKAQDDQELAGLKKNICRKDDSYIRKYSSTPLREQKLLMDMYDIVMEYLGSKDRNN